jgi:hypothetical protein
MVMDWLEDTLEVMRVTRSRRQPLKIYADEALLS